MGSAAAGLAASAMPSLARADARFDLGEPRRLGLHNIHTDERIDAVYWERGGYVPQALNAVNRVVRDFRTGDVHPIHPELLDLLNVLAARVDVDAPFQVISGYRSPQTNAMLRASHAHSGVAEKSLHMQGMAMDIRLPGLALDRLHNAALSLGRGGVGYYPVSGFVHVDVGAVRTWYGA